MVIGYPGSVGDARIFRNSPIGHTYSIKLAEAPVRSVFVCDTEHVQIPMYILGDSAFGNTVHMVTTYEMTEVNSNVDIKRFNRRLSAMRFIVENAFGVLKGRWRVLLDGVMYGQHDIEVVCTYILSLCILHNYLMYFFRENFFSLLFLLVSLLFLLHNE